MRFPRTMRAQLLECLMRIAVAKYNHEIKDVSECIEKLFDEHIDCNLVPEATHDPDEFRNERLYNEDVDNVFKRHLRPLKLLYDKYSMLNPVGGKARFELDEWMKLVTDGGLLSDDLTTRECRFAFFFSRMVVADEVKARHKIYGLTWVSYLEVRLYFG